MKYKKKPVVIDAVQATAKVGVKNGLTVMSFNINELKDFCPALYESKSGLYIRTLEGDMHVTPGDYIIKGVQGEFYPCKPDIFKQTYEKVEGPHE